MTRPEYLRALKAAADAWKVVSHAWDSRERAAYMSLAARYCGWHGVLPSPPLVQA